MSVTRIVSLPVPKATDAFGPVRLGGSGRDHLRQQLSGFRTRAGASPRTARAQIGSPGPSSDGNAAMKPATQNAEIERWRADAILGRSSNPSKTRTGARIRLTLSANRQT
jgi:hypothetical protein